MSPDHGDTYGVGPSGADWRGNSQTTPGDARPYVDERYGGVPSHGMLARRWPKGYTRPDERIRDDVYDRLTRSDVDAAAVAVDVKDGQVTLRGTVPERWMRHRIEDLADTCAGVKDIDNRLRVVR